MIDGVSLKNFQSHKSTDITFGAGLNVIIGDSDKGKSAIFRGLRWAYENRPSGTEYISRWALNDKGNQKEETVVAVRKAGKELHRVRTKKENLYIVDGVKLGAVGRDVPEEAQKFFGFNDVNTQNQMDPPFLLSESASKVSQVFNQIIKLEVIDTALTAAESMKRATRAKVANTKADIEEVDKDLERYNNLDVLEKAVGAYNEIGESRERLLSREFGLTELQEGIREVQNDIALLEKVIPVSDAISEYAIALNEYTGMERVNKGLTALVEEIGVNTHLPSEGRILGRVVAAIQEFQNNRDARERENNTAIGLIRLVNEIKEQDTILSGLSKIPEIEILLKKSSEELQVIDTLDNSMLQLAKMVGNISITDDTIKTVPVEIEQLKKQLPDTCPLCGRTGEHDEIHG